MGVTAVGLIRGAAPTDLGSGSGYGYGDGSGYGYGDGSGYGYGYGDGSGYDLVSCSSARVTVTSDHLRRRNACADQLRRFEALFPNGATWPDDADKARDAGLDLEWARKNLGLLVSK